MLPPRFASTFATMVLVAGGLTITAVDEAEAIPVSFSCVSGNSVTDCATGEAQFSVNVSDLGSNQVLFEFTNAGPAASSITDVYFDDGTLLGIAALIDEDDSFGGSFGDPGVDYSLGASPPNLPGGNSVGFVVTAGFAADSDPPITANGVNPGETLGVVFDLQVGRVYADVIDDLTTGELRIGVRGQGFTGGGSEGYVNLPVPEPGSAMLIGLGLGILGRQKRRADR